MHISVAFICACMCVLVCVCLQMCSVCVWLLLSHLQPPALALSMLHRSVWIPRVDSLQMFQSQFLWWLFTTSTANWVPNCFCSIHCGGCAIWFEAGERQSWGITSKKCVCVCVSMCSNSRVCTKHYSLACTESADSDFWNVPQVQRAKGAFIMDISLFDIPLIA